jgi:hypothetical protein
VTYCQPLRACGLALLLFLAAEQASAQGAVQLCREKGSDDGLRPIPRSVVPAVMRIFGLRMPDQQVLHAIVFCSADGTPKVIAQIEGFDPAVLLHAAGSARIDSQPFPHDGARPWHS